MLALGLVTIQSREILKLARTCILNLKETPSDKPTLCSQCTSTQAARRANNMRLADAYLPTVDACSGPLAGVWPSPPAEAPPTGQLQLRGNQATVGCPPVQIFSNHHAVELVGTKRRLWDLYPVMPVLSMPVKPTGKPLIFIVIIMYPSQGLVSSRISKPKARLV